jgi:hypothetical protein
MSPVQHSRSRLVTPRTIILTHRVLCLILRLCRRVLTGFTIALLACSTSLSPWREWGSHGHRVPREHWSSGTEKGTTTKKSRTAEALVDHGSRSAPMRRRGWSADAAVFIRVHQPRREYRVARLTCSIEAETRGSRFGLSPCPDEMVLVSTETISSIAVFWDGPYYGIEGRSAVSSPLWALIAQPNVRMTWPIVAASSWV